MPTLGDYKLLVSDLGYDNILAQNVNVLVRAINGGRRDVVDERRWPFLHQSNSGVVLALNASSVAIPLGMRHVDSVRAEATGIELELVHKPLQVVLEKLHLDRVAGQPCFWTRRAGNILVYPKADRQYTLSVEGAASPADLVNDVDVDVLPEEAKWAVAWAAAVRLAFRQRDPASLQAAKTEYAQALAKLHAQYGVEQRQTSDRVQSSGFYDEPQFLYDELW